NKWIGTEHGLFKFDGTTWTKYDDTNSEMFGENAAAVLVDESGTVWVGCGEPVYPPYPSGLCSFDGTTWTAYSTTNSGLPEKYVNDLALDTLGNIWVLTEGHGAAIFNPSGVTGYDCIDKSLQSCSIATGITPSVFNVSLSSSTAFPNPFSSTTNLQFSLTQSSNVNLFIYDLSGREIGRIEKNNLLAGINDVQIDLSLLQPGIYSCKIQSNEGSQSIKLIKN
ncbi:MAG: T9SS type A sorting domain-containing protein, partial [Chitinophagales bacterium]